MVNKDVSCIYGPVSSWRLGVSLGIDLFSSTKICNFDCIYCQLDRTDKYSGKPRLYVSTRQVISELKKLARIKIDPAPLKYSKKQLFPNIKRCGVDYLTFSGLGEPTLAKNLGQVIRAVKKIDIAPVAVLTNASLFTQEDIRRNLSCADFVVAKLDAYSEESFKKINQPLKTIKFRNIIQGIIRFKNDFKGKFALQIMFVEENKKSVSRLVKLAKFICPDEVQINTPLRFCNAKSLSKEDITRIKKFFAGLNPISVYDAPRRKVSYLSRKETLRRRGKEIKGG